MQEKEKWPEDADVHFSTQPRTRWMEDEANIFACIILIPKVLIKQDLAAERDLGSDNWFKDLCKKYQVPMAAMVFRIQLLYTHKI